MGGAPLQPNVVIDGGGAGGSTAIASVVCGLAFSHANGSTCKILVTVLP